MAPPLTASSCVTCLRKPNLSSNLPSAILHGADEDILSFKEMMREVKKNLYTSNIITVTLESALLS